jgi:hypothetical protein
MQKIAASLSSKGLRKNLFTISINNVSSSRQEAKVLQTYLKKYCRDC